MELIQAPMCVQKVPDSQILKNMYIKSRIYRVYDITPYLSIGNCPIGVERADRSLLFIHFSSKCSPRGTIWVLLGGPGYALETLGCPARSKAPLYSSVGQLWPAFSISRDPKESPRESQRLQKYAQSDPRGKEKRSRKRVFFNRAKP